MLLLEAGPVHPGPAPTNIRNGDVLVTKNLESDTVRRGSQDRQGVLSAPSIGIVSY